MAHPARSRRAALYDDEFSAAVERAIRSAEAWTVRDPDSAEAWFYLGGAYAARVQWRVLRNEKLAAARDGKRIKEVLERALALDPGLDDAYFGIGMYRYYADVAPTAAKVLRFLLLLPGGDRKEGLAQMLRARTQGRLLQGEADYQLHILYLWYEKQTAQALSLLRGLQKEYPANPLFLASIAEVEDAYQHDISASLQTWRSLLDAGAGRPRQRGSPGRSPRPARRSRGTSTRSPRPTTRSSTSSGSSSSSRKRRSRRWRWRTCGSARRTTVSTRGPRRWRPIAAPRWRRRTSIPTTSGARHRSDCAGRRRRARRKRSDSRSRAGADSARRTSAAPPPRSNSR